ncbi:hypothetical protein NPIL_256711 [Nephila pilipes]|uniref:Uncharacterized protein n=1 Tax=Nephila pilipes TaxID=299642 RepID=A0A8X6QM39_NEPPI|nr:hypothetical protein NPIL_256711 [Nephila pilipes]
MEYLPFSFSLSPTDGAMQLRFPTQSLNSWRTCSDGQQVRGRAEKLRMWFRCLIYTWSCIEPGQGEPQAMVFQVSNLPWKISTYFLYMLWPNDNSEKNPSSIIL